ncbi:Thioredoxin [uncultured archaeon]|nr:Thioredoxin [uncultured archaeon]
MAKKKQRVPEKKFNWTIVYGVLAVIFIAAVAIYFTSAPPQKPQTQNIMQPAPGKVKIVEFMKFDCPHCYDLHQELPRILEKYGNNVTITYVPIVFPGQSTESIEAYIIADQMGKGAEMQDALFNEAHSEMVNGKVIGTNLMLMESVPTLEGVAASIGLGADFNAKLEGGDARNAASANLALMTNYGVDSTPTIFVNGKRIGSTAADLDSSLSSLLG